MLCMYADNQLLYLPILPEHRTISPRLTREVGKAGSLEFGLPTSNLLYSSIKKLKTIVTVEQDNKEIFRGRVRTDDKGFNNVKQVYVEGVLSYLSDSRQKPEAYVGKTRDLFAKIVSGHNSRVEPEKQFKIGVVNIEDRDIIIRGTSDNVVGEDGRRDFKQIEINSITDNWQTTMNYLVACLIDYCGGYLRVRYESDGLYLDYLADYGNVANQSIDFGVNLIDLTEQTPDDEFFTVLIPLGDENLTVSSVNNGSDEICDDESVALYGRIINTHVFDGVNNPSTLLDNGRVYLANKINNSATYTIKAVDLHAVDRTITGFELGDSVPINSSPHGIRKRMTCTKIELPMDDIGNTIFTFGTPMPSLTQSYLRDKQKKDKKRGGGGGKTSDELDEELEEFKVDVATFSAELTKNVTDHSAEINAIVTRTSSLENGSAQLQLLIDDTRAQVNLKADWNSVNTHTQSIADLILRASAIEASVALKADFTSVQANTTSIASLTQRATANEASIALKAEKSALDSVAQGVASLDLKVTSLESSVALKASKTLVDGHTASIASLTLTANNLGSAITAQANLISLKSDALSVDNRFTTVNTDLLGIHSDITVIKGDLLVIDQKTVTITGDVANLNSEITNIKNLKASTAYVDDLVAAQITALKGNIAWLEGKYVTVATLAANTIYAYSGGIKINGEDVATQTWANGRFLRSLPDHRHQVYIVSGYTGYLNTTYPL